MVLSWLEWIQSYLPYITAIATVVIAGGVIAAFWQVRAAKKNLRAQTLMRLIKEWRSTEVFDAVRYVNKLRNEWKQSVLNTNQSLSNWQDHFEDFAKKWVETHAETEDGKLKTEWGMRRTASQFLSKMGYLEAEGYLSRKDLFGVVPEVGRLLTVLGPIEFHIQKYWDEKERKAIDHWDHPVGKWEFNKLWDTYRHWYRKHGKKQNMKRFWRSYS